MNFPLGILVRPRITPLSSSSRISAPSRNGPSSMSFGPVSHSPPDRPPKAGACNSTVTTFQTGSGEGLFADEHPAINAVADATDSGTAILRVTLLILAAFDHPPRRRNPILTRHCVDRHPYTPRTPRRTERSGCTVRRWTRTRVHRSVAVGAGCSHLGIQFGELIDRQPSTLVRGHRGRNRDGRPGSIGSTLIGSTRRSTISPRSPMNSSTDKISSPIEDAA